MSLQTHYKRIVKAGFVNFYRSGVVSIASVLVMTVTLFIISALLLLNAILNFSLAEIQNKVDINVYFYPESAESQVLEFKTLLEGLPEVAEVTYVSREQALVDFQERHEGDFLTLQALEELGENPLGASLNVRATDSTLYENIARFIEGRGQAGHRCREQHRAGQLSPKRAGDQETQQYYLYRAHPRASGHAVVCDYLGLDCL